MSNPSSGGAPNDEDSTRAASSSATSSSSSSSASSSSSSAAPSSAPSSSHPTHPTRPSIHHLTIPSTSGSGGEDYTASSPLVHALRHDTLVGIAQQHRSADDGFSLDGGERKEDPNATEDDEDLPDTTHLLYQSKLKRDRSISEIAQRYTVGGGGSGGGDDSAAPLLTPQTQHLSSSASPVAPPPAARTTSIDKSDRFGCSIPSIFGHDHTDDEHLHAHSQKASLNTNDHEWKYRAANVVLRHKQSSKLYSVSSWPDPCASLSFRDQDAERAFQYYFSSLNEHKLRRRLLLLNFLYMIYATLEWGTRTSKHYTKQQQNWITTLRASYIVINAAIFTWSFVVRNTYRKKIQECSTFLSLLTSTLIIVESHLLRNIYSPFVLCILLMYMIGSNIYVRTLFTPSLLICIWNLVLYNFVCLVWNGSGDLNTIHTKNDALLQLFYFDLILLFFIFTILYQTRTVEKQQRFAFLMYYVELEQEEREEEERKRREGKSGIGGPQKEKGGVKSSGVQQRRRPAGSSTTVGSTPQPSESTQEQLMESGGLGSGGAGGPEYGTYAGHEIAAPHPAVLQQQQSYYAASSSSSPQPPLSQRQHLLPQTREEELALLAEINEAEKAEDPFYLSKLTNLFLPQQQVGASSGAPIDTAASVDPTRSALTSPKGKSSYSMMGGLESEKGVAAASSHAAAASSSSDAPPSKPQYETVHANDPLYTTLSIMRARGITSLGAFIRMLTHQSVLAKQQEKMRKEKERKSVAVGGEDVDGFPSLDKSPSSPPSVHSTHPCILCSTSLPPWFTSYPYVLDSYRVNYTTKQCIHSIFQWHNETVNIWTEFVPFILFLVAFIVLEVLDPTVFAATTTAWDRVFVLNGLLCGLILRPLISGLAHTFYCQSHRSFVVWWSADYVSILLAIMGFGLVQGRFTFWCMESQQIFFFLSVFVLFLSTIAAVLFVASPGIRTSSFLLYILFANGVPYVYQLVLTAADLEQHDVPHQYLVLWTLMWCLMLIGLIIKSVMVPERWAPGRFDLIGASHQWWHVFINAGAALAYFTWKSYLKWRPTVPCEASFGVD